MKGVKLDKIIGLNNFKKNNNYFLIFYQKNNNYFLIFYQ
jgi:hypothetical protein